jgi:hypothetical protein
MRKRLSCFRGSRGGKVKESRTTRELESYLRVTFARGGRSQQNQRTKYFVGLCGEIGNKKEMAAGLSSDGNRDNGEDKVLICSKRTASDSGSEGPNRRDTWRAGVRGNGERRGGPTCGCVDSGPRNGLGVGRNEYVARNRYSNRGQDSIERGDSPTCSCR